MKISLADKEYNLIENIHENKLFLERNKTLVILDRVLSNVKAKFFENDEEKFKIFLTSISDNFEKALEQDELNYNIYCYSLFTALMYKLYPGDYQKELLK